MTYDIDEERNDAQQEYHSCQNVVSLGERTSSQGRERLHKYDMSATAFQRRRNI